MVTSSIFHSGDEAIEVAKSTAHRIPDARKFYIRYPLTFIERKSVRAGALKIISVFQLIRRFKLVT